jgi:oxygen-independent coproporphyrinogen-3 oxidase
LAGIYIHIPYCKQACSYCDFYFTTSLSSKPKFIEAILKEIELQKNFFSGQQIKTIYFGGGTPSMLSKSELNSMLKAIHENFAVDPEAEITLEANPDNLIQSYLYELLEIGVNRLSVGLQSFKDLELVEMNRSHNAKQSIECIKMAQETGFKNISVDFIYGTPWTSEAEWMDQLDEVIKLNIQHISCYQLTIEEKTVLHHKIKTGVLAQPDDERTEKQFLILIKKLRDAGFVHYEISNFGLPGYFSKHNSSYWKNIPYLGLGPSAHGYNGTSRFANMRNIHAYCEAINLEKKWFIVEQLTPKDIYNDYVLTGLRTVFGVELPLIEKKLDQSFVNYFQRKAQPFIESGEIIKEGYVYRLKEESFLFADRISSELFYI